jgi:hypothetical protein
MAARHDADSHSTAQPCGPPARDVSLIEPRRQHREFQMKQEAVKVLFRLPKDMKAWLEEQAELNWTSQNAEAIRAIRSRMEAESQQKVAAG